MSPVSHSLVCLAGLLLLTILSSQPNAVDCTSITQHPQPPTSTACPAHCSCTEPRPGRVHVRCTSVDGLTHLDKTATVRTIDLSNIGLERIAAHQLNAFTSLANVILSHNNLSAVPALPSAKRLSTLRLDHNRITSAKLHNLPAAVQHLDLSHNHLTYLPAKDLQRLHRLRSVKLAGNPINCTCESVKLLSWLHDHQVEIDDWMCQAPAKAKGMAWQMITEREACATESIEKDVNIWNEGENHIAPASTSSGDHLMALAADEFERDFMRLDRKLTKRQLVDETVVDDIVDDGSGDAEAQATEDDVDGSGDSNVGTEKVTLTAVEAVSKAVDADEDDEDDDGSGSGGGAIVGAGATEEQTTVVAGVANDEDGDEDDGDDDDDDDSDAIQPHKLNIFQNSPPSTEATTLAAETDTIVPPIDPKAVPAADVHPASGSHPHRVTAAEKETAESTYIVLVMLAILLLGLIVFVAIRRKAAARQRAAANGYDIENGNGHGKELVDMNRSRPGKPTNGNGRGQEHDPKSDVEVLPLIGARDKWDSRIQPANGLTKPDQEELRRAQEPLLRRLEEDLPEAQPPQALPRTLGKVDGEEGGDSPAFDAEANNNYDHPAADGSHDQNDHPTAASENEEEAEASAPAVEVFQPVSPKPARYSPVYSPITGRVKIKLTETPKPRTPMLVSRTRSNAGDLVTTTVRPAK